MALGNTYNNNSRSQQEYRPTVNSQYRWYNSESNVDKTALTVSFWKGLIKFAIAPKKNAADPTDQSFDYQNEIRLHLTHTKARIFYEEIRRFLDKESTNVGVNTNKGLIALTDGAEFGTTNPCFVIKIVNPETGVVEASACYETKSNYHFAVRNFDENNKTFDNVYYNDIEIYEFMDVLKTYYEAMTNAVAYSVIDQMTYENNRTASRLMSIQEKLGINTSRNSRGSGGFNNSSYFNNKPSEDSASKSNSSVKSESYETVIDLLEE